MKTLIADIGAKEVDPEIEKIEGGDLIQGAGLEVDLLGMFFF